MKCTNCGKEERELVVDPRDSEQEILVCEACEYEICARAASINSEIIESYEVKHGA